MLTHSLSRFFPLEVVQKKLPRRRPAALAATALLLATFSGLSPSAFGDQSISSEFRFLEKAADANFFSFDSCLIRSVFVRAADSEQRSTSAGMPQRFSTVFFSIFEFNVCTPAPFVSLSGAATLGEQDFEIQGNLDRATLSATVQVFDFSTGGLIPVTLDLQWQGADESVLGKSRSRFESEFGQSANRFRAENLSRAVQATGSVIAIGRNFTADESSFAQISQSENRSAFQFQQ